MSLKKLYTFFLIFFLPNKKRLSVQCISPGALNIFKHIILKQLHLWRGDLRRIENISLKTYFPLQGRSYTTYWRVCWCERVKPISPLWSIVKQFSSCAFHLQFKTLCSKVNPGTSTSWFSSRCRTWWRPKKYNNRSQRNVIAKTVLEKKLWY